MSLIHDTLAKNSSLTSLKKLSAFSGTVIEINLVRNKLFGVFGYWLKLSFVLAADQEANWNSSQISSCCNEKVRVKVAAPSVVHTILTVCAFIMLYSSRKVIDKQVQSMQPPSDEVPKSAPAITIAISPSAQRRPPVLVHHASATPLRSAGPSSGDTYRMSLVGDNYDESSSYLHHPIRSPHHQHVNSYSSMASNGHNLNSSAGNTMQKKQSQLARNNSDGLRNAFDLMPGSAGPSPLHILTGSSMSSAANGANPTSNPKSATKSSTHKVQALRSGLRLTGFSHLALGVLNRCGSSDPELGPWLRKVRSSNINTRLYEALRGILQQQRRRYVVMLNANSVKRRTNAV